MIKNATLRGRSGESVERQAPLIQGNIIKENDKKNDFMKSRFQTWTEALGVKLPVKKLVSSSTPCTCVSLLLLDLSMMMQEVHVMGS